MKSNWSLVWIDAVYCTLHSYNRYGHGRSRSLKSMSVERMSLGHGLKIYFSRLDRPNGVTVDEIHHTQKP